MRSRFSSSRSRAHACHVTLSSGCRGVCSTAYACSAAAGPLRAEEKSPLPALVTQGPLVSWGPGPGAHLPSRSRLAGLLAFLRAHRAPPSPGPLSSCPSAGSARPGRPSGQHPGLFAGPSSVFRGLSSLCRTASPPTALLLHPALVSRHSRHLLTDPRLAVFVVCCLSPPTRMSTPPGQRVGTGLFGGTTTPQAPRAKSALRAEGAKASRHAAAEPGVGACTLPAAVAGASLVGPCEQPGGQWAPLGGRSRVRNGPAQSCAPGQQEGVREG